MGRKKRSVVYKYYNLNEDRISSVCLQPGCDRVLRTQHATNLLKHLYHSHKDLYLEVDELNKCRQLVDKEANAQTKINNGVSRRQRHSSSPSAQQANNSKMARLSVDSNEADDTGNNSDTNYINEEEIDETQFNEDPLNTEAERKRKSNEMSAIVKQRDKLLQERNMYRAHLMRRAEKKSNDALGKLFDSLCQKTRELPKYLQLRIQREVFISVNKAEEEVLSLSNRGSLSHSNVYSNNVHNNAPTRVDLVEEDQKNIIQRDEDSS